MKYYVLGRVSDASHAPWVCVAETNDYLDAMRRSDDLEGKPGCESSVVEDSALTTKTRNAYRAQLERRKATV